MGGVNVVRLSPQNPNFGLGTSAPLGGLSSVSSANLSFSNDLVSGLQSVTDLNLGQIQVAGLLSSVSLDCVEGLKDLGAEGVVAVIVPQLRAKQGIITTSDVIESLKAIELKKKEIPVQGLALAQEGQAVDVISDPDAMAAQGRPMVVSQGALDETVLVATVNIDNVNTAVAIDSPPPVAIDTEVRTLTKAEIKMLRDNGNTGNLDKIFVPVSITQAEVSALFSQIRGNIILGDVVLFPVSGKISIQRSILNKVVIAGQTTILESDLENVSLAVDGGSIKYSVVLGAKLEGSVDVYKSIVINSNVYNSAVINNSLVQYAEVESRSDITRSQVVGTAKKPVIVGVITRVFLHHMLGSTREIRALNPLESIVASMHLIHSNMRTLLDGKPLSVHETGSDSPIFKASARTTGAPVRVLGPAEINALRARGIVINKGARIIVSKNTTLADLEAMIEPGAVLSGKVYLLGKPTNIHIQNGAVLYDVVLRGNVTIQANSIVSGSVLTSTVVAGGTVRDSYLQKTTIEEGSVVLRSTIDGREMVTVGRYANVVNSHLGNFEVVGYSLIGNTVMANENGPTQIGGSIFSENVSVSEAFHVLSSTLKASFQGFFRSLGLELQNIRFASGQTNQILFQIDENGKIVVVIMADIKERAGMLEQWTSNPGQLAGRFFMLGMLARPNLPYIEAIQPKLEKAADGEEVTFRIDIVEMADQRAFERQFDGRPVQWEKPDDRESLLKYINGESTNEDRDRTVIVNFIDRLAEAENILLLKEVLYIFEENITKSRAHFRRISDIVKDLKPETKALMYDVYQYEFIAK